MQGKSCSIFLVSIFLISLVSPLAEANSPNRQIDVEIYVSPDGISDDYTIEVPAGDIVSKLEFEITEQPHTIDDILTLSKKTDWASGTYIEGIDYNKSGLRVAPNSFEWDFEGSAQGWTFSGGGWAHGFDTTLGSVSGVNSGNSALYTYNGNYPSYMGGPYYATSPSIDCSACSGSWDFKYWKRLGVESRSYDSAVVQVKNSNNAWITVYQNPFATVIDGSFSQSSHDISSYISGNSNFQVRFGLGSSDGSVEYTGWNIDDITIEPKTNAGTGSGNWTSMPFGPGVQGAMATSFGMMSIDAEMPAGSSVEWTLVNFVDGQELPGFIGRVDLTADLGSISVDDYSMLQIKIFMTSTMESPVVNQIKFGGAIINSFSNNDGGWTGYSAISNGELTGVDQIFSPKWRVSNPFSEAHFVSVISGTGSLEVCFVDFTNCNTNNWSKIPQNGIYRLNQPSVHLNVKWNGTGNYVFEYFQADLLRHSSPEGVEIDIGLDGISEWSMSRTGLGPWGHQNRLIDSNHSKVINTGTSIEQSVELFYPFSNENRSKFGTLATMQFFLTPKSQQVGNVNLEFYVNSNQILTKSIGSLNQPKRIELSSMDIMSIEGQIASSNPESSINGLDLHKLRIQISSNTNAEILFSGLSIPYSFTAIIQDDASKDIISSINSKLGEVNVQDGTRVSKIPVLMSNRGSITITEYVLETTGTPNPISITLANETETIVAGNDWYEFTSLFDLTNLNLNDAETHFLNNGWDSLFTLSGNNWVREMDCSLIDRNCIVDEGIIFEEFNYSFSEYTVEFYFKIKISTQWPNEIALIALNSIDMDGITSQPSALRFGLGTSMGVERDVTVTDWGISFGNGSRSSIIDSYIDTGGECTIEVEINFANLTTTPRNNTVNIGLVVDGNLQDSTQELINGVATLNFSPDADATKIEIEITVAGLLGQSVYWNIDKNATFYLDEISPVIISSNVGKFDHMPVNEPLSLQFLIADRPVLPRHAYLHLSSDSSDIKVIELDKPNNLNGFQGNYSKLIDMSDYEEGDVVSGWLEIIDPAGHELVDSGSIDNPYFTIKIGNDGSPVINQNGFGWGQDDYWLHPAQEYSIHIPISDSNGYGDISVVSIDLGFGANENLILEWDALSGCISASLSVQIINCTIIGNASHFDSEFTLEVKFELDWEFNPDSSMIRTVMVEVEDDAGQSYSKELERKWRFSSEVEVKLDSAGFVNNNSFVAPGNPGYFQTEVIWSKDGSSVMESFEVMAMYSDYYFYGTTENGSALIEITASNYSGIYPINLDLINLPLGAIDRTTNDRIVAWVVVDGNKPVVNQLLAPNQFEQIQERDWKDLQFEISLNEPEGLNSDSILLNWLLVPRGMTLPEFAILSGNTSMEVIAGTGSGDSIPLASSIDLDGLIPELSRKDSWDLWVWVTGSDLAGQMISDKFNNRSMPLAKLELASRTSELVLNDHQILLESQDIVVGKPIQINVTVENIGLVDGITSLRIEVIEGSKNRRLIEIVNLQVPGNNSERFEVTWTPEETGAAWIEITTPDGKFARTSPVKVSDDSSEYVIEGLEGADTAMLTGFSIVIIGMIGLLSYLVVSGRRYQVDSEEESEFD